MWILGLLILIFILVNFVLAIDCYDSIRNMSYIELLNCNYLYLVQLI